MKNTMIIIRVLNQVWALLAVFVGILSLVISQFHLAMLRSIVVARIRRALVNRPSISSAWLSARHEYPGQKPDVL